MWDRLTVDSKHDVSRSTEVSVKTSSGPSEKPEGFQSDFRSDSGTLTVRGVKYTVMLDREAAEDSGRGRVVLDRDRPGGSPLLHSGAERELR